MPFTHRQLVANTPEITKLRTRVCGIRLVEAGKHIEDKKLGKVFRLLYNLRCLDGNRFVTLRYIGASYGVAGKREQVYAKPSADSEVWVSCTCPYHMYNSEYALAQNGSSDIIYGNGSPASMRNPSNTGLVCKHILLALQHALQESAPEPVKEKPSWKQRLTDLIQQRGKEKAPAETTEEAPAEEPEEAVEVPAEEPADEEAAEPENATGEQPKSWKDKLKDWLNIRN